MPDDDDLGETAAGGLPSAARRGGCCGTGGGVSDKTPARELQLHAIQQAGERPTRLSGRRTWMLCRALGRMPPRRSKKVAVVSMSSAGLGPGRLRPRPSERLPLYNGR